MSSIEKKPLQRMWSKGKEGGYDLVNSNSGKVSTHVVTPSRNRKRNNSDTRTSTRSINSYSLEEEDDATSDQQFSPDGSLSASLLKEDESAESSLLDEEYFWESLSVDEDESVRLLSSQRKTSVALDQILLDINPERKESDDDEYADVDVKAIAAAISGRRESEVSESDSDSDTSTTVSEGSDVDDATSDEESDKESDHEVFDMDYHINKLVKGGSESESDNDSTSETDGSESAASEKLFQKAVQKVMKKFKRERSQEIVESDLESTETTDKGSETEESPTSEDSASETSDQEQDLSDESSKETDPEIVKPVENGWVIDPTKMSENERISAVREKAKNEGLPKKGEAYPAKAEVLLQENEKTQEVNLAPTLEESNAQDLRWPLSNFYVKEFKQDLEMSLSDNEEALPSYKSTAASAAHPGRKRNVMLGRVWWVEWWAKEENKFHTL